MHADLRDLVAQEVRELFARDGPAALDEAHVIYQAGQITSTRWARAMRLGLEDYEHEQLENTCPSDCWRNPEQSA